MERDFLKRYVDEHKEAFENEALPPNMLGNILINLKEREQVQKTQKTRKLNYSWLAAACALLLVAGTYLFISKDTTQVDQLNQQWVAKPKNMVAQPQTDSTAELPMIEKAVVKPNKQLVVYQPKATPHQEIYSALTDSSSVANRMNAILKIEALAALNHQMKVELCKTFNEDNNDNVRLAALDVLAKFSNDNYIHEQLVTGLVKQKDPVVQLELIKIMGNNSNPETTDKLIAMANNPFTVNAVKEQVYYALLTNNN